MLTLSFQVLVRKLSRGAYEKDSFVLRRRAKRFKEMMRRIGAPPRAKVVDLGGSPLIWSLVPHEYNVTLVNLPGAKLVGKGLEKFCLVEADACELQAVFSDKSFDVAFSNSVIEHVGDEGRQEAFASEVRRLAHAYWVQTPSDRCPIEAHTGVLYYWRLPRAFRERMHRRWQKNLPGWFDMIQGTRVLSRRRLMGLFPESELYVERIWGIEKSYSVYRPFPGKEGESICSPPETREFD